MKDLDARQELLIITMEECGELIQACSKALRRGELFPNSDSEMQLKQEIADVYCMIELMQDFDIISWEEIEDGVERKRNKLKQWSKLINDPTPPKTEPPLNEPYTQKVIYGHTSASSEPMSEYEEQEWKRIEQVLESQKRGKESI
jgi:NTP pyrophosphatase (non-canonical NTP hydrolase)